MILDFSCVKDILIEVEDKSTFSNTLTFTIDENNLDFPKLYSRYPAETIMYHVRYCIDAGLLKYVDLVEHMRMYPTPHNTLEHVRITPDTSQIDIYDVTPLGHDMATTLRNENLCTKAIDLISKAGLNSLPSWLNIIEQVRNFPC